MCAIGKHTRKKKGMLNASISYRVKQGSKDGCHVDLLKVVQDKNGRMSCLLICTQ